MCDGCYVTVCRVLYKVMQQQAQPSARGAQSQAGDSRMHTPVKQAEAGGGVGVGGGVGGTRNLTPRREVAWAQDVPGSLSPSRHMSPNPTLAPFASPAGALSRDINSLVSIPPTIQKHPTSTSSHSIHRGA